MQVQIVEPQSANPGYGRFEIIAEADHITLCKPPHRKHVAYRLTRNLLLSVMHGAGQPRDGEDTDADGEEALFQA